MAGTGSLVQAIAAQSLLPLLVPRPSLIPANSAMLLAAGLVLAVAAGPLALAAVPLAAAQLLRGAGPSLYGVSQRTFRQSLIAPGQLAQATAAWQFLVYGAQALGALAGGAPTTATGPRATLLITSAGMLAATTLAAASPLRTLRTLPEPDQSAPPAAA